jgi:hypothetical protein
MTALLFYLRRKVLQVYRHQGANTTGTNTLGANTIGANTVRQPQAVTQLRHIHDKTRWELIMQVAAC